MALSHGVWLMTKNSYGCTTVPNKIISRCPSECPFSSWWLLFTLDVHSSCPGETNLTLLIFTFTIVTSYSMPFSDFYPIPTNSFLLLVSTDKSMLVWGFVWGFFGFVPFLATWHATTLMWVMLLKLWASGPKSYSGFPLLAIPPTEL